MLKNVGDFRLLDRKYIDAIKQLRENERYTKFFAGQASTTSVINSMNFHYNHKTIIKKKKMSLKENIKTNDTIAYKEIRPMGHFAG